METLLATIEKQKNLTNSALEKIKKVLDEINELYPNEDIWVGQIKLKDYVQARGSGFTFDGYYFDGGDNYKSGFIPEDNEDIAKGFYYAGNYNAWVQYTNKKALKYIMANLKKWVEEKKKEENKFNQELDEILNNF